MVLRGKMATYKLSAWVRVELLDWAPTLREWMRVWIEFWNDAKKVIIGNLDNEPLNDDEG